MLVYLLLSFKYGRYYQWRLFESGKGRYSSCSHQGLISPFASHGPAHPPSGVAGLVEVVMELSQDGGDTPLDVTIHPTS